MFKLNEIKELIKLVDQTSLQELEIENEGSRLSIRKPNKTETVVVNSAPAIQHAVPIAAQTAPEVKASADPSTSIPSAGNIKPEHDESLHKIVSPMVGTFYRAPSPDSAPFVQVGDRVNQKTVVCIVEAMKLMNEIEAEVNGQIVDILVENGQLVEYGQPLFVVKAD